MKIIDGKKISNQIKDEIKKEVDSIIASNQKVPHLAGVLGGEGWASLTYVGSKVRSCKQVGFDSTLIRLPSTITESSLIEEINKLNKNKLIDGFIVQLPLPENINQEKILSQVDPHKDVDGFHPINYGKMALGIDTFLPATPAGIIELIERSKIQTQGKKCLVIGRSQIVGRPISILLSQSKVFGNSTVTVAHSKTINLKELCIDFDLIISAIGKPEFIKGDMVKKGSTIIDVGITRVDDSSSHKGYRIAGDVDFNSVSSSVGFITPVPGGVGPMTIAMLLKNTLKACSLSD